MPQTKENDFNMKPVDATKKIKKHFYKFFQILLFMNEWALRVEFVSALFKRVIEVK